MKTLEEVRIDVVAIECNDVIATSGGVSDGMEGIGTGFDIEE